jgi:hypothetical protein
MAETAIFSADDLIRRVTKALDSAEDAIAMLGANGAQIDLTALEAPPDKVIAETAIFLRTVTAIPTGAAGGLAARARGLFKTLAPFARNSHVAMNIAFQPALARDYAVAHIMLTTIGFPDPTFAKLLASAVGAPVATGRERVPHRELEQYWLAALTDGRPIPHDLLARTALAQGVDLLTGNRDDSYALTHAMMYGSDFGNWRTWRPAYWSSILGRARSALAGALDDDDFDLAGELLLAWPLLEAPWDDGGALGFAVLANVEDTVGVLPALALRRAEYLQQPVAARQHHLTAMTYHSAYVMGLLCAILLQRKSRPTVSDAGLPKPAGFAEELLRELADDQRRPQWLGQVLSCPPQERGRHTLFLLDVAVRRSVRRLDLARTQGLLQRALHLNIPLTPLCAQATQLLRRVAACPQLTPVAQPHAAAS